MIISIVNHSNGQVTDEELQRAIAAINRQIAEHFAPYWSMSAALRLEGRSVDLPETVQMSDMRGDSVIYLWDKTDIPDALGYHFQNNRGIPFGFVFTEIAKAIGEPWSVTLSHEALELLADPETNLLVIGPHPSEGRDVFHWFEMCDAVQAETYEIDDVLVSNFVLPLYFTGTQDTDEPGARNDYLGRRYGSETLKSFGINPGGYVGFFDPQTGNHETFSMKGDPIARMRLAEKSKAKEARRSVRYRNVAVRKKIRAANSGDALRTEQTRAVASAKAHIAAAGGRRTFESINVPIANGATGRSLTGKKKVARSGRRKRPA